MSLILVSPPAGEPVSLDQLKARLRITHGDFDQRLTHLITAARERVEREAGLVCLTQTWLERRDDWDGDGRLTAFRTQFRLLNPPLQTLLKVTLYDAEDHSALWDSDNYYTDTQGIPARIITRPGVSFPQPGRAASGLELRFVCGFGDQAEDVPAPICEAIERYAAHLFGQGAQAGLPPEVRTLLAPWRRLSL